jgi:hypothetical protein
MRKVTVTLLTVGLTIAACLPARAQLTVQSFGLKANPPFINCLRSSPAVTPNAIVTITEGSPNDDLTIFVGGIKPGLTFDLFTVEKSNLTAAGVVNPNVKNFGLAWYQSDLEADAFGRIGATIRTIIVNQI